MKGDQWRFLYEGVVAGNGGGGIVSTDTAALLMEAFTNPPRFEVIRQVQLTDNSGFCERCCVAYCFTHWDPSTTGWGTCPRGHGTGLDPHWSADL